MSASGRSSGPSYRARSGLCGGNCHDHAPRRDFFGSPSLSTQHRSTRQLVLPATVLGLVISVLGCGKSTQPLGESSPGNAQQFEDAAWLYQTYYAPLQLPAEGAERLVMPSLRMQANCFALLRHEGEDMVKRTTEFHDRSMAAFSSERGKSAISAFKGALSEGPTAIPPVNSLGMTHDEIEQRTREAVAKFTFPQLSDEERRAVEAAEARDAEAQAASLKRVQSARLPYPILSPDMSHHCFSNAYAFIGAVDARADAQGTARRGKP